jgi:hypothetical protein
MTELPSLRLPAPVWRTPLVQWQLSAALARDISAADDACWTNALRAAARASERLGEPVRWVEGVAVARTGALPMLHGWLEADGLVLDPTPAWCAGRGAPRGRRYMRIATVEPGELHAARDASVRAGRPLRLPLWFNGDRFAEIGRREQGAVRTACGGADPTQLLRAAATALGGTRSGSDPFGLDWR